MTATGVAILCVTDVDRADLIHCECIETQADKRLKLKSENNFRRAQRIAVRIGELVREYSPAAVCSELPAGSKSAAAVGQMNMATGFVGGALTALGIPVESCTPHELKDAVTGDKQASKEEIQEVVFRKWPVHPVPSTKKKREAIADAMGAWLGCRHRPLITALLNAER